MAQLKRKIKACGKMISVRKGAQDRYSNETRAEGAQLCPKEESSGGLPESTSNWKKFYSLSSNYIGNNIKPYQMITQNTQ